jgi:RimJ/RimL family protein N-acetyltransferase
VVPYDRVVELRDVDLVLRPINAGDVDAIADGLGDAETTRYLVAVPHPYSRADAEGWVTRCTEAWQTGQAFPFAIVEAGSGEFLGSIELTSGRSIGYWLTTGARGRGVATHALQMVCEWAEERPLRLTTHPDNVASQRVAERAGFRRVGISSEHPRFKDGTSEAVLFELD